MRSLLPSQRSRFGPGFLALFVGADSRAALRFFAVFFVSCLIERFHAMIRKKEADQLDPWIAEASSSLVSSFATGVASRGPMFRSRLRSPNSNSSNARCTAAQNSTFFKPDCSALHESANRHRDCVRAKSRSRHTLDAGRSRRKLTRRHQDVTQIHCDIAP